MEKKVQFEVYDEDYKGYSVILEDIEDSPYKENKEDGAMLVPFNQGFDNVPLEITQPFKFFNCWKCHANFPITAKLMLGVEKIEGIELLLPVTRYSFIFGVGKMFSDADVRELVTKYLVQNII
jgi:hypothetical protein